ncbi:lytic transglycosylase domain-containing protein [Candidatus Thalassolituus haligoni]|uniref:lytic transglycosylase domain-containing protein n=1 Tax=Candidatus Thalassolituus haligoni TaxID=3100113 RepID=UPI003517779D
MLNSKAPALLLTVILSGHCAPGMAEAMPNHDPELRVALLGAVSTAESFPDRFDAEVWLMDMQSRLDGMKWIKLKNQRERLEFLRLVHHEASRAGISPEMVLAVIQVESAFDRFAVSRVGARGYMQIMPFWKNEIGRSDDNLMHTPTNLRYGCTILRHYLDKENGNWIRALARYNGSLGRTVYPEKVMSAWEKYWFVNY